MHPCWPWPAARAPSKKSAPCRTSACTPRVLDASQESTAEVCVAGGRHAPRATRPLFGLCSAAYPSAKLPSRCRPTGLRHQWPWPCSACSRDRVCVACYDVDLAEELGQLPWPVSQVANCALGGPDLARCTSPPPTAGSRVTSGQSRRQAGGFGRTGWPGSASAQLCRMSRRCSACRSAVERAATSHRLSQAAPWLGACAGGSVAVPWPAGGNPAHGLRRGCSRHRPARQRPPASL